MFSGKRRIRVAKGNGVEMNVVSPDFGFVIFLKKLDMGAGT